jgi:hypothetical protein
MRKTPIFFAENCQKSQKIMIITSTPVTPFNSFICLRGLGSDPRDRCYDHNFLPFLPIISEKMAHLSKTNAMITFYAKSPFVRNTNANFLPNFSANIF